MIRNAERCGYYNPLTSLLGKLQCLFKAGKLFVTCAADSKALGLRKARRKQLCSLKCSLSVPMKNSDRNE